MLIMRDLVLLASLSINDNTSTRAPRPTSILTFFLSQKDKNDGANQESPLQPMYMPVILPLDLSPTLCKFAYWVSISLNIFTSLSSGLALWCHPCTNSNI